MLDFGCGCGRVARHWATLTDVEIHGTDYNETLVKWCQEKLRFMETGQNDLEPPLSYRDGRFDFIYSISIFTHLPIDLQHAWVEELRRVLRPGGALMITVLGKTFADRVLEGDESAAFAAGRPVVHREKLAGSNACASFAPHSWVVGSLLKDFEVLAFLPHEEGKAFGQNMYLAIKN
jgi:ubiquinone/menaquinone biosynthesis C-methylase UbiE